MDDEHDMEKLKEMADKFEALRRSRNEASKRYVERHREKNQAYQRSYYARNKDKILDRRKERRRGRASREDEGGKDA